MSKHNSFKESQKEKDQFNNIKSLLKDKNLNPNKINDLKYLLSLTINPTIKRFNFECLLLFLLKYLNKENEPIFYDYFFKLCELGKIQMVKILLDNSINVNCQNEHGETPLHIAVANNDKELTQLLIKYDPDTHIQKYQDKLTAVNYAEICGDKRIIKMINEFNEKKHKKKNSRRNL